MIALLLRRGLNRGRARNRFTWDITCADGRRVAPVACIQATGVARPQEVAASIGVVQDLAHGRPTVSCRRAAICLLTKQLGETKHLLKEG